MTIDPGLFKQTLQQWASGISVVTTNGADSGPHGMTVTAFASVSADPPQILVCVNSAVSTAEAIVNNGVFAVNILSAQQEDVSNAFAGGTSQEERFQSVTWHPGDNGLPLLDGCLAVLQCRVSNKMLAGTHWIVVGEVCNAEVFAGEPLLYYKAGYRQL